MINKKLNFKNSKIVLKRFGSKKQMFFRILILNKFNKYQAIIGSVYLLDLKIKNIIINKFLIFKALSQGSKISYNVSKLLRYLLINN